MPVPLHIVELIRTTLTNNQRETGGHFYTVPSSSSYPYQWLWDSCFNALTYCHLGTPELAERELHSLTVKQWENGLIPHMHYWEPNAEVMNVDWGVPDTSTLMQPPLIAYVTWQVYRQTKNREWLETMYPALTRWHEYLLRERQLPDRALYGLVNPDESGEDNSPRFDEAQGLPPQHEVKENRDKRFALFDVHKSYDYVANGGTHEHFWVEDIPTNVFAIASLEAMAAIATELGTTDATIYTNAAHNTANALREYCFADGSFWSAQGPNKPLVHVNTWARFAPLFAGLYTPAEAAALVAEHFHDAASFATAYPLPTVAQNDPSYAPEEPTWGDAWQHPDWRGSVWMLPNWCVYHGLVHYGFTKEATQLREQSINLIEQSGMRENYHPQTGAGQGAEGFTWSGLVLDMQTS
jgi:glycogen debranching enzyme